MKNIVQKSAVALIAAVTITLVSGNALLAQDRRAGDLITTADLAFIKSGPVYSQTKIVSARQIPPAGLITSADFRIVARPYAAAVGSHQARVAPEPVGIITAADYRFLTTGQTTDLFSVYNDLADSLADRLAR